jgi:hypothetical protein
MGLFYHTGESAPSAQPVRITGQVLDRGEPFAGDQVELYPAAPIYTAFSLLAAGSSSRARTCPPRVVVQEIVLSGNPD